MSTPRIVGSHPGNFACTLTEYAGIPGTKPGARSIPEAPAGTRLLGNGIGMRMASTVRCVGYAANAVRRAARRSAGDRSSLISERVRTSVSISTQSSGKLHKLAITAPYGRGSETLAEPQALLPLGAILIFPSRRLVELSKWPIFSSATQVRT